MKLDKMTVTYHCTRTVMGQAVELGCGVNVTLDEGEKAKEVYPRVHAYLAKMVDEQAEQQIQAVAARASVDTEACV